ncbi:MAG TPA: hypothetical protein VFX59_05445 [Polyangiales bacterium]|nr:hypothetical protein [Polyangiales bacterium]
MKLRTTVAAACCLVTLSCSDPELTQVLVTVKPEAQVRAQASGVRVQVSAQTAGTAPAVLAEQTSAPWNDDGTYTISLVPKHPERDARYRVEVSAIAGSTVVATARLISGYVQGDTRYVYMLLSDSCRGVVCSADSTCVDGACRSAALEPGELARTIEEASAARITSQDSGIAPYVPDVPEAGRPDASPPVLSEPDSGVSDGGQPDVSDEASLPARDAGSDAGDAGGDAGSDAGRDAGPPASIDPVVKPNGKMSLLLLVDAPSGSQPAPSYVVQALDNDTGEPLGITGTSNELGRLTLAGLPVGKKVMFKVLGVAPGTIDTYSANYPLEVNGGGEEVVHVTPKASSDIVPTLLSDSATGYTFTPDASKGPILGAVYHWGPDFKRWPIGCATVKIDNDAGDPIRYVGPNNLPQAGFTKTSPVNSRFFIGNTNTGKQTIRAYDPAGNELGSTTLYVFPRSAGANGDISLRAEIYVSGASNPAPAGCTQ